MFRADSKHCRRRRAARSRRHRAEAHIPRADSTANNNSAAGSSSRRKDDTIPVGSTARTSSDSPMRGTAAPAPRFRSNVYPSCLSLPPFTRPRDMPTRPGWSAGHSVGRCDSRSTLRCQAHSGEVVKMEKGSRICCSSAGYLRNQAETRSTLSISSRLGVAAFSGC